MIRSRTILLTAFGTLVVLLLYTSLMTRRNISHLKEDADQVLLSLEAVDALRDVLDGAAGAAPDRQQLRTQTGARIQAERAQLAERKLRYEQQYRFSQRFAAAVTLGRLAAIVGFLLLLLRHARKQEESERLLSESEQRLKAVAEESPVPLFLHQAGRLAYVNPAAVALFRGKGAEDLIGRPVLDLVHPDDQERVRERIKAGLETGKSNPNSEENLIALDGTVLQVEAQARATIYRGEPAMAVFVRDISERKHAEARILALNRELELRVQERTAQLETTVRELESFNYSVSHDLRSPLRGIDGFSQVLLEDYSDRLDAEGQHYLTRIRLGAQRMGQLIDALLKMSRLNRGELHRQDLDLSALARKVAGELERSDPARRVEVTIPDGMRVWADPAMMQLVMENLLSNAWKFTSRQERTRIELGQEPAPAGATTFSVRDNGVGFDMAFADKLFHPFQRLHPDASFPGTGIGLAMVQRIVMRHGGRAWAEARPGEGAAIFVTVPGP